MTAWGLFGPKKSLPPVPKTPGAKKQIPPSKGKGGTPKGGGKKSIGLAVPLMLALLALFLVGAATHHTTPKPGLGTWALALTDEGAHQVALPTRLLDGLEQWRAQRDGGAR